MPQTQVYASIVDPASGVLQEYVTLVDSSGNLVYAANQTPQGRLTLTTAVPVLTATVSASANVFYTPYSGNIVPCWNGTRFAPEVFTELTNVLANSSVGNAGPAAGAAATVYDLFVWKSGTTLYLTRGPAWTSDTARSAGTVLTRVNGVLVNSVAITNGPAIGYGTYVGTIRTDAAGATVTFDFGGAATDGTQFGWAGVWNYYNRRLMEFIVQDTEASWTYSSATIRAVNGDVGNRISYVIGVGEDALRAQYHQYMTTAAVAASFGIVGIALDATNTNSTHRGQVYTNAAAVFSQVGMSFYEALATGGFHFLQAVEQSDGTNNFTATGNSLNFQGLRAQIWC